MQSAHIAITGALLFAAGCALPEEGALATGEQNEWLDPMVADDDSSLRLADSPMESPIESMEMEAPGILGDSSEVERHDRSKKWVCVARHRSCRGRDGHHDGRGRDYGRDDHRRDRDHDRDRDRDRDRDDHDGDFGSCDTEYYYATARKKHRARRKALHECSHNQPHSGYKCKIEECYHK